MVLFLFFSCAFRMVLLISCFSYGALGLVLLVRYSFYGTLGSALLDGSWVLCRALGMRTIGGLRFLAYNDMSKSFLVPYTFEMA